MPIDSEYLAQAGIQDTPEGVVEQTPSTGETVPAQSAPTPEQKVEMFEFAGQQFPVNSEFKLTHGGKILKVPAQSMFNTYRQHQHKEDKWNEYKPKIDEFEKMRPEYDRYKGFYDKYGKLQEWSEQNPKQWNQLYDMYQQKDKLLMGAPADQPGQVNNQPFIEEITRLKEEIGQMKPILDSYSKDQEEKREADDVNFVKNEIDVIQKKYPEINLQEKDPEGVTLYAKICNWGINNGYKKFTPAAREYLADRIEDTIASRARNEAMKSIKTDKQNGIISRSPTPTLGKEGKPINVKGMSYAEIAQMAKQGAFATGT